MQKRTVTKVMLGCSLNNLLMELQMSQQPNTANLITFLQFFSISIYGFIFTVKMGRVKPSIPIKQYTILVGLFFVTSVANNFVYTLHVPSTLHMIIRSASLAASVLVSWYMKRKPPERNKLIGSALVSVGVAIAMYGGAKVVDEEAGAFFQWCLGVAILISTLLLGALTGLQQEKLFSKYGRHHEEMLFYTNVLSLPFFLGIYPSLKYSLFNLDLYDGVLISGNIISQFVCANAVYELATTENSVTVTLILTVRKFISLIISAIVFKNNLTNFHFLGCLLVVGGTCVYFNYLIPKNEVRECNIKNYRN